MRQLDWTLAMHLSVDSSKTCANMMTMMRISARPSIKIALLWRDAEVYQEKPGNRKYGTGVGRGFFPATTATNTAARIAAR